MQPKLTDQQKLIRDELSEGVDQIYSEDGFEYTLSDEERRELYDTLSQKAHTLHSELKDSGQEPIHSKKLVENRGLSPDSLEFYKHPDTLKSLVNILFDMNSSKSSESKVNKKGQLEEISEMYRLHLVENNEFLNEKISYEQSKTNASDWETEYGISADLITFRSRGKHLSTKTFKGSVIYGEAHCHFLENGVVIESFFGEVENSPDNTTSSYWDNLIVKSIDDISEHENFDLAISETNAFAWMVDDYSIDNISVNGINVLLTISFHAVGEQYPNKPVLQNEFSGVATFSYDFMAEVIMLESVDVLHWPEDLNSSFADQNVIPNELNYDELFAELSSSSKNSVQLIDVARLVDIENKVLSSAPLLRGNLHFLNLVKKYSVSEIWALTSSKVDGVYTKDNKTFIVANCIFTSPLNESSKRLSIYATAIGEEKGDTISWIVARYSDEAVNISQTSGGNYSTQSNLLEEYQDYVLGGKNFSESLSALLVITAELAKEKALPSANLTLLVNVMYRYSDFQNDSFIKLFKSSAGYSSHHKYPDLTTNEVDDAGHAFWWNYTDSEKLNLQTIQVTVELRDILKEAKHIARKTSLNSSNYSVEPHHLIIAIIKLYQSANSSIVLVIANGGFFEDFKKLIDRLNENVGEWSRILDELTSTDEKVIDGISWYGKGTDNITREADSPCLNAELYAEALAEFFTTIEGEMCFGLFGRWGRGKTYLMNLVSRKLEKKGYAVINFKAWKYRTAPSLWIHLYETFAKNVKELSRIKRFIVFFRVGINRHGFLPLIGILFIFILGLLGWTTTGKALMWGVSVLGIGTVFFLFRLWRSFQKARLALTEKYLSIPSHCEKLGIQEVIGNDLSVLVKSWTQNNTVKLSRFRGRFFSPISFIKSQGDKILLVVDDLDRCEMSEMLTVVESLVLLLDDDGLKERIQIVMLIEDEAIRLALANKYIEMVRSRNFSLLQKEDSDQLPTHDTNPYKLDRELYSKLKNEVVEENIEKLFLSYLRLEDLTVSEINEIINKTIEESGLSENTGEVEEEGQLEVDTPTRERSVESDGSFVKPGLYASPGTSHVKTPSKRIKQTNQAFSKGELNKINGYISAIVSDSTSQKVWGPRAIRACIFKYQLARLLLRKLEKNRFDVNKLLIAFENALKEKYIASHELNEPSSDIYQKVVRQVI